MLQFTSYDFKSAPNNQQCPGRLKVLHVYYTPVTIYSNHSLMLKENHLNRECESLTPMFRAAKYFLNFIDLSFKYHI